MLLIINFLLMSEWQSHGVVPVNDRAFAYLSAEADKHGRVIIYIKAENYAPHMPPDDYLKTLVHIINKYLQP